MVEVTAERRREDRQAAKGIADRVREARQSARMSEERFAESLLLEPRKLKSYEQGRYRFSARHVAIAAALFGRDIGWFFSGTVEAARG